MSVRELRQISFSLSFICYISFLKYVNHVVLSDVSARFFSVEEFRPEFPWEAKDLREDLLLLLVWVVTIGELSILQCTVNNTTTNTLSDKQQNKNKAAGGFDDESFWFFLCFSFLFQQ